MHKINGNYFNVLFISTLLLFSQSCTTPMYLPGTPNIPICDTINKFESEVALNNRGVDLKLSYRLTCSWNVAAGYNYLANKSCGEITTGYFKKFNKMAYGISAGYGL
jgi:hypothetical protein